MTLRLHSCTALKKNTFLLSKNLNYRFVILDVHNWYINSDTITCQIVSVSLCYNSCSLFVAALIDIGYNYRVGSYINASGINIYANPNNVAYSPPLPSQQIPSYIQGYSLPGQKRGMATHNMTSSSKILTIRTTYNRGYPQLGEVKARLLIT